VKLFVSGDTIIIKAATELSSTCYC